MRLDDIPQLSGANRFGHLGELRRDRLGLLRRMNEEGGDAARLTAMGTPLLFANSPELLHDILVEKAKSFAKSAGLRGPLKPLAGDGLFTSEGELWRRQRKLMAPLFTHAQIDGYASEMAACAEAAVKDLRDGQELDVARLTTHVAMRIAGKTLFDADTLDEADELGAALTVALGWVNFISGWPPYAVQLRGVALLWALAERVSPGLLERGVGIWEKAIEPIRWPTRRTREVEAALAVIERRVARMIADRRAAGLDRKDLLTLLLAAHDDHGDRMSDKQVRDEVVTLFVAGHETTASGLAWSLYLLSKHPDAYARVKAEASILKDRSATAADLPRLAFCQRVFKEALRLYPPIYFFGRQSMTDVRVGPYDLAAGTVVLISPWCVHHRPEVWPDPERFDPSRFEHAAEEARHKQAYLPFSAGPRTCIGNHFALMEGPLVLATILARVDLTLTSNATVVPEMSATLRPKGGVRMRVSRPREGDAPSPPL
jgi:cytochrome P450